MTATRLIPSRLAIAKSFSVDEHDVNIGVGFDRDSKTFTMNFKVSASEPISFSMLHELMRPYGEHIECRTFGTTVTQCSLSPPLPSCDGCVLAVGR